MYKLTVEAILPSKESKQLVSVADSIEIIKDIIYTKDIKDMTLVDKRIKVFGGDIKESFANFLRTFANMMDVPEAIMLSPFGKEEPFIIPELISVFVAGILYCTNEESVKEVQGRLLDYTFNFKGGC